MKKAVLILFVFLSFLSCKNEKETKDISVEKEIEVYIEPSATTNLDISTMYAEKGLEYALSTKAVLGKNLVQAIEKDGTIGALAFCNVQAIPLTDSMAVVHNAQIKRVTDKPRNQANQANAEELSYIETYKNSIANQEVPEPLVKDMGSKVQVYYPILTNAMCLQCHGKPNSTIEPMVLKKLTMLYPKDKAIGYDLNEVRGIWSVTFDK